MRFGFWSRAVTLLVISFANASQAGENFVSVFLDSRPVTGISVVINDEVKGITAIDGSLVFDLPAGEYQLELLQGDAHLLTYSYDLSADEGADLSVTFSESFDQPDVQIEKYNGDSSAASPGVVQGLVTDSAGNPLANAKVEIVEPALFATTNAQGAYRIEAPRGEYTLRVQHPDFRASSPQPIKVVANGGLAVNVTLQSESAVAAAGVGAPNLEEMTVMGRFNPMDSTVDIERMSTSIVDAVDATQLARFGDTNVASALRRVAGVSVNDDKYAVVRGLDGRYISSTLNKNLMPTTDPLRRDVQLDLFPNNILGRIEIQKSYSADLPGDTTGGSIGMTTKDVPDEWASKLSVSLGYNFDVTGDDIVTYEGSGSDWLTFDDGLRELPAEVGQVFLANTPESVNTCNITGCDITFEENARLGQQFPVIYNVKTESARPDFELGYSLGNVHDLSFGSLGYYGAVSLKNKTTTRIDARINDSDKNSVYERSKKSSYLNGYFVLGLDDSLGNNWTSKTIFLRQADDVTRLEAGYNSDEENEFEKAILHWTERQFLAQQFSGTVPLFDTHEFGWRAGVSQTTMDEPDRRTWEYIGGVFLPAAVERRFAELKEDGVDFGADYSLPVDFSSSITTEFKAGVLYNKRERNWDIARFSFRRGQGGYPEDLTTDPETQLSRENLQNQHYQLRKSTAASDSFDAEIETSAGYLNTETNFGEAFTLVAGVRQESNIQKLVYPFATDDATPPLDESDLLPALSLNYTLNDNWQFRGAFSNTVSRPGVIERSESTMYDPDTDEQIFGNPNLVSAAIDNFDLRAEYYFDDGGNITVAGFVKKIDRPIEKTIPEGSGSATDGYTFRNALSADLTGVEVDFNKMVVDATGWSLELSGNFSWIESEVDLDEDSIRLEGVDSIGRELQGQSPYLANLLVGFDHHGSMQQVNLLINYFDDKIEKVGRGSSLGNLIEAGRTTLDLNYSKTFSNDGELKVKLKNLLNEATEYVQDGTTVETYKEGVELSVGYSHAF